nr:MAG: hypothetical protein [Sichuan deltaflexi-like virus 2]
MQLPLLDLTLHSIQFAAILGDLTHKTDVYLSTQSFAPNVTCLFANCEQAGYLFNYHPTLIPPGNWNNHSIGTFFEFFYYSNLTFRLSYLNTLPSLDCHC